MSFDWTRGGRVDSFRYVRVAWPSFCEVGEIDLVTGCDIEEDMLSALKVTGTLNVAGDLALGDDLVRVYSTSSFEGVSATVCHGTLFANVPAVERSAGGVLVAASLYSVLKVLQDEVLDETLTVPAGVDPVARAASLVRDRRLAVTATPYGGVLAGDMVFEPGTTVLEVVDGLLDAAGYCTADVDAYGGVVMRPYADPSGCAVAAVLGETGPDTAIVSPGVSREVDRSKVYNVVTVVGADADGNPLRAQARNDSPSSAWSTVSRGRVVSSFEEVAGASTQEALEAKAAAALRESAMVADRVVLEHPWCPFEMGDALRVEFPSLGVCGRYSAVARTRSMVPGIRCTTTARRFVDLEAM